MLYGHVTFTDFIDEIDFGTDIGRFDSIANVWQVGFAVGRREKPLKVWFLNFDRLGLGFKFSSQSELRGVRFIFRSIYEL